MSEHRPTPLLHNMSVAPRTVLEHRCDEPRRYGSGFVFEMPALSQACTVPCLLELLGIDASSEAELRRLLHEHARTLSLPAAAVVTNRIETADRRCDELLDVLTVLSKSSAHVYLRDKEPNLASLVPGRRVIVLVPSTEGDSA